MQNSHKQHTKKPAVWQVFLCLCTSVTAVREVFTPQLEYRPILSAKRGRYNAAIKPRAETACRLCRGGAVKGRQRRASARQKSQRWIVLNVQPLLGFLLAEVGIRVFTTKLEEWEFNHLSPQQSSTYLHGDNSADL